MQFINYAQLYILVLLYYHKCDGFHEQAFIKSKPWYINNLCVTLLWTLSVKFQKAIYQFMVYLIAFTDSEMTQTLLFIASEVHV